VSQTFVILGPSVWITSGAFVCAVALCGCKRPPASVSEREPIALGSTDSTARLPALAPTLQSATNNAEPKTLIAVKLGMVQLELQGCVLTFSSPHSKGRFDVALQGTCAFADDAKGAVQVVTTPQGPVVLVEASRPVPPTHPNENSCDTRIRGVLVRGDSVFVSNDIQKVASCGSGPWDEVMARVFALRAVPIESESADSG